MKPLTAAASAGAPGGEGHRIFLAGDEGRDPQRAQRLQRALGRSAFLAGGWMRGPQKGGAVLSQ